ncbi:hypothetical protein Salat_1332600 [Sesamum alatum]|uniref:NAD(P)H dehydrogenase subunit CRR3, chloroplastic n=1 Tax=Sesamum alatum TaxID=300844 RepID=A0AAE1YHJ9_9LAMI|nr:hypothetical protein Salat_1332600 [Sesamum alatum]
MAILNCHSIVKPQILASSAQPNESSSPSLSPQPNLKPIRLPKANSRKLQEKVYQKQGQAQQPSILEIERAIGAGIFRDRDTNREAEEKESLFDNMLRNSVGKSEGSVEKKLRETGEWLIERTKQTSRSAGKQIVMAMFVWMIPVWIFAFAVASGMVQLPFDTPFLEDLIS